MVKSLVIGTAGHIDHGKSTLVKALTGTDPDRLKEEKKRGITLDLGFAHRSTDSAELYFVDVPGHEDLIRNMLAGANGLDLLLLVVAADEGIMPQTREHFEIARLLGMERGILVLTRADLADEVTLELAQEELKEFVQGSFLEEAPLLAVSSVTGQGMDELLALLAEQEPSARKKAPFRLPIDRSFTLKGHGTVVTGTVTSGEFRLEEELWLYPERIPVKVRGMQTHGHATDELHQGERAALNLAGLAKEQIERGFQLAKPDSLILTRRIEAKLDWLEAEPKHRASLTLYCNAQETTARLLHLGEGYYRLELAKPMALRFQDRLILRSYSPKKTLGGGQVLTLNRPKRRLPKEELTRLLTELDRTSPEDDPQNRLKALAELKGIQGLFFDEIEPLLGISAKQASSLLAKLLSDQEILLVDPARKRYLHQSALHRVTGFLTRALQQYHKEFPERSGAPPDYFKGKFKNLFGLEEIALLLKWAHKQNVLAKVDNFYHLLTFQGALSKRQRELKEKLLAKLEENGLGLISLINLAEELQVELSELQELTKIAKSEGWLVQIKENFFQRPQALDEAKARLIVYLKQQEEITVIDFKELLGLARKEAVALLEYFDQSKVTIRLDNIRQLR